MTDSTFAAAVLEYAEAVTVALVPVLAGYAYTNIRALWVARGHKADGLDAIAAGAGAAYTYGAANGLKIDNKADLAKMLEYGAQHVVMSNPIAVLSTIGTGTPTEMAATIGKAIEAQLGVQALPQDPSINVGSTSSVTATAPAGGSVAASAKDAPAS